MFHFFTDTSNFKDGKVYISGNDYNHIRNVIRLKCGDKAVVSDPEGGAYTCHIEEFTEDEVVFVIDEVGRDNELPVRITLYQGLPKLDKLESIIQKCVELGAYRIVPVAMQRCVVKLDDKKKEAKTKRWNAISEAAAKQSGRGIIPEVDAPISFTDALRDASESGQRIVVAYEEAEGMNNLRKLIEDITRSDLQETEIAIFIGPEGGFEPSEIDALKEADADIISLGRRILRTETAGPALISTLMLEIEMSANTMI